MLWVTALAFVVGSAPTAESSSATLTPHTGHAMATAGATGGVFLVGGAVIAGDSTWRFTGEEWQRLAAGGPANRNMVAAAFDTRRNVLVAFGGVGARNGSRYGETWEWNGRAWEERDVRGPGARDHHAMAYDEARGQVVMFGGMNGDHKDLQSDTWTWDGATWTRAEEQSGPGGLAHHALAYDAARRRVVLYGGITNNGPATDDVWEWDGKTWQRIAAPGPGARSHIKLAYDAARGVVVMFGGGVPGAGASATPPTDTWTWDGRTWTRAATVGPPARFLHAMAYDARRERVVMTAGTRSARPYDVLSDTWEWDGAAWREAMTMLVSGLGDTGDLGIDTRRNRAAVPRLDNNAVEVWRLGFQPDS